MQRQMLSKMLCSRIRCWSLLQGAVRLGKEHSGLGFIRLDTPKFLHNGPNKIKSGCRLFSSNQGNNSSSDRMRRAKSTVYYVAAAGILTLGMSYASVPLYRMFCQAYSYGGTTGVADDGLKVEKMNKISNRIIKIKFNADIGASMRWNFKPQQTEIKVAPGETALAFYTARNPTDNPVIGISTYNVVPFEAGQYFNKIQCFCFEEQMLNPHEEVDMPVFFYIDPEFAEDPKMEYVDTITLSYTFFEAKEGLKLPVPSYVRQ